MCDKGGSACTWRAGEGIPVFLGERFEGQQECSKPDI